jgi:pimeloyl-ACP methyl ester carboxylesterase
MNALAPIDLEDWIARRHTMVWRGHSISYWSEGAGVPLLLVHGFPTSSWDWSWMWEALKTRFTLIAPDFLGFGLSDKPRQPYSLMDQADLLEAVLAHCGHGTARVLCHDYGVSPVQELIARQNAQSSLVSLSRVCFLNGGMFPGVHRARPIQKLGASPLGFLVSLLLSKSRFNNAFSEVFGADTQPDAEQLASHWALINHQKGQAITHRLLRYMAERELHRARWVGGLKITPLPLLHVNGADDPVSGSHMFAEWQRILPHQPAVLLDGIGHYPQCEAPARVLEACFDWLSTDEEEAIR